MNCSDWQIRIAADDVDDAAVAEHVSVCPECRDFARELDQNTAALRSIVVDGTAFAALRSRVMAAVQPRRRFGWVWAGASALAIAASVALVWWTAPLPTPRIPRSPARARPLVGPTEVALPRQVAFHKRRPAKRPVRQQLTAIKLLTDDPNVVIIWLVDDKKETNNE